VTSDASTDPGPRPAQHRAISRRRLLIGGGVLTGTVAAGAVAVRTLPLRRWVDRLTHECGDAGPVPPVSEAQRTDGTFASTVLGFDVGYALALPPGRSPGDPLPVAFMLPGRGGTASSIMDDTHMADFVAQGIAERGVEPFALAAVDGGASYWHARASGEDRMAMLTQEFAPMCEDRWRLGQEHPRALIGWSMGGYGALLAAQEHPDLFVAAAAASPAVWRSFEEMESAVGDAFDSAEDFAAHDLFAHHDRLERLEVRIDCGTADGFLANDKALAAALDPTPAGTFFEGCHDAESWRVVAAAQVEFLGAALSL
jgi:S-formylglutathione hydrolase FrmB